jgi:Carboxypeptidase regulatory-like domain/TonB dependent receptor
MGMERLGQVGVAWLPLARRRQSVSVQIVYNKNLLDIQEVPTVACRTNGVFAVHRRSDMIRARIAWPLALTLVLLLGGSVPCLAQLFPGRITGTVRDAQGATIAGATVKLTNPATGLERTVTTGENGEFNFPELSLGTYQLTVSKTGFNTAVLKDITTSQAAVNTIDPVLAVGSVSTEVEVNTAPLLLQTETNSAGGQLSEVQVTNLPIGNSDYTRLALVLPGAVQNSNFAFAQYSINGSRARSNGFNIDGISNTDPSTYLPSLNEGGNSATAATRLPLDAVEEVSVVSAGGADKGQNSGSVMDVIVKSGTNDFHGSAYELHRDAALDAKNFFENAANPPVKKAPFVWNEFGASAGGPIYIPHVYDGRNRTFFFAAYDGSRLRLGTTQTGFAPTAQDIQDATTALASVNIVPNQLGLNIANVYKSYQGLNLSGFFVHDNRGRQSPNSFIFKLDHKISDSDSLSARFVHATGEDEFPGGGPGPGGGSQLNPWFGVTPTNVDNFAVSEVHILSPSLINTLRLGWNRFGQFQKGRDFNVDPSTIGLNTGVGPESFGLPEIDLGNPSFDCMKNPACGRYANLGLQNGAGGRIATSFQVADDVSVTRGKHAFKFGFNYLRDYSDYTLVGSRGLLTFDGSQLGDSLIKNFSFANPAGVEGLIDLFAGLPAPGPTTSISRVGSGRANIDQNIVSGFAMDNFKVTSKLTLIAGLRYDFFGTVDESRGRFSAFDPHLGLVPASQLPGGHLYDAPKRNFGPRIAVSWAPGVTLVPGRQLVVRAGYGIYYDTIPLNNFEEGLAQNPVGPTAGFVITPAPPIPFGVGVPIFGAGAPQPPFNIASIDPHLKTPNTQIWNLNIQQELSPRVVLEIGYVGNKSTHQLQDLDINQPTPGPASADNGQSRRPLNAIFPTLGQINTISSVGWANYDSLQVVLKSTNFHGLTTQAAFTWSHNLDTASEVDDFFGTSGYIPQDSTNLKGSYGNSEFDQRRSLVITYIYAIPSPKWEGAASIVLRNWQLAGTTTYRDGLATPVLAGGNVSGIFSNHDRPNCVGPFHYQLQDFSQSYVVDIAHAFPTNMVQGTFGNCARNPIVAPGLIDWDISLQRTFKFAERFSFEFRTAFFNAFNHPNFAEPAPFVGGTIGFTADDGSFDSHFGVGGPRNIQLSGKIRW